MKGERRWQCTCGWIGEESEILTAPNPFDPGDTVVGCPLCKEVGDFDELCDEPGCNRTTSCGFQTKDGGYRRTCHEHSEWKR
jgi:hypothetical protein